jgi:hypothetical protein
VQLREESFDDLINGLEKPEVETYKRGWERFAEAAILGREADATGQPLDAQCAEFLSDGNGFRELDRLYVPKPGIANPQHWGDYSQELVSGAIDKLVALLK